MAILTFNPLKQKRSRRWWAFSIAIHAALIFALAQIVFRYPIGQLLGLPKTRIQQERIIYVATPRPSSGSAQTTKATPQPASPAPLTAPRTTPTTVTPPPLDSNRSQAAGGRGTGRDGTGSGIATGVVPAMPDSRIPLTAEHAIITPRTMEEEVDSMITLAVGIVQDSLAFLARQRKPGDWTKTTKDGKVWGMDPQGNIRLGKFVIPGALLALLPLNAQSAQSPIEQRSAAYNRADIIRHAGYAVTEDEFRSAVKRIRQRKEKERQRQLAEGKGKTTTP